MEIVLNCFFGRVGLFAAQYANNTRTTFTTHPGVKVFYARHFSYGTMPWGHVTYDFVIRYYHDFVIRY